MRLLQRLSMIFWILPVLFSNPAIAHESQPGLLELKQLGPERYEVIWRAPIYYGKPHPAELQLPGSWSTVGEPTVRQLPDSALHRRIVDVGSDSIDGSLARALHDQAPGRFADRAGRHGDTGGHAAKLHLDAHACQQNQGRGQVDRARNLATLAGFLEPSRSHVLVGLRGAAIRGLRMT